jgi:Domain of unknown function (DUF6265)
MKNTFIAFVLFLFANCTFAQPSISEFIKLDWLAGKWNRTNAKTGRSGYEVWKKISKTEWIGKGVTMKGTDTLFVEKLKLICREGNIYYVADVPQNKSEVLFKFTELSEHGFVCENPQHDFPKKIAYTLDDNKLKAIISGDGKIMEYLFEKVQ